MIISSAQAANLKVGIIEQFNDYIREVEARLAPRFHGEGFLWTDQSRRSGKKVAAGQIAIDKGGMIQDWQGAVFIKGAKLDSVLRVVQDYANHAKNYSPDIVSSKVVSHTGNHWLVVMRTLKTKLFLT